MTRRLPKRSRSRGLAIIEAAIIFPLILFLLLVVAELGRGIFQFNTLHKSVRDGARDAAERAVVDPTLNVNQASLNTLRPRIQNLVACGVPTCVGGQRLLPGLEPAQVTVTGVGPDIVVSVNYTFQPVFSAGIPQFFIGGGGASVIVGPTLSATAAMRALQ